VFTRLGAVLDLSLLVPAYLLAAVWLWRRRASGYLLATAVLAAGALHQLSYVPGAAFDPYEPAIFALYALGGALLVGNRGADPRTARAQPNRVPASVGR
jgi:hypothetical protein